MSIQQHAQNILDLCTAGPIQGGISIEIKREAQAIVDSFEWFDCKDKKPKSEGLVVMGVSARGRLMRCRCGYGGWIYEGKTPPVKWRELI